MNFPGPLVLLPQILAALKKIVNAILPLIEQMKGLATKDDVTASTAELSGEMKAIGDAILSSAEASKTDLTASTSELRGEINELRGETKAMAAELRGEISSAVNKMLLAQLAIAGLLFAALWILG